MTPATGRGEKGGVLTTCDGRYDCVAIPAGCAIGTVLVAGIGTEAGKVVTVSGAFTIGTLDGAVIAAGVATEPYAGFKVAGACVNCTASGKEACGVFLIARGSCTSALVSTREPESAFAKYGSSS